MKLTSTEDLYKIFLSSNNISIDSRNINKGDLFFALKGENFNGNDFAISCLEKGAMASVVDNPEIAKSNPQLVLVKNVLESLQQLAKIHRNQLKIPVIGLTGSNGKTTTKELIAIVMNRKFKTSFTKGNLNNHIGVPLSLLNIKPYHEIAVIEMGANHQREIAFLANIAQPDIGLITNFGKAHIEGFGGVEGVIKGKTELYDYLFDNNKTVLINLDDEIQVARSSKIQNQIRFSLSASEADVFVKYLNYNEDNIVLEYNNLIINSQLTGKYNLQNIAAAIALGKHFNIPDNEIKIAIEDYCPTNSRSQIIKLKNGSKIILDAYNANPTSMTEALRNLSELRGSKSIILGDMFELGKDSLDEHRAIIKLIQELNIQEGSFIGDYFFESNNRLNAIGKLKFFKNIEEFKNFVSNRPENIPSDYILIKGSRKSQLEKVLPLIS